jgi:hypothetical protein
MRARFDVERSRMRAPYPTRDGAVRAALAVVAVIASFGVMLGIGRASGTGSQPALLAAILTLGVSRRHQHARAMQAATYPLALAAVALVAGAVGILLRTVPIAGATVFVAGLFLSIWLRNFGERGRRFGALIALPFVTMLVVPVGPIRAPGGPLVDLGVVVAAGIVALGSVRAIGALASALRLPAAEADADSPRAPRERKPGTRSVPTRMAIQMTVALTLAFGAGFALFARHWGWTVLTAFIVCSGAIGRGDAAYKAALRLVGAIAGTAAATLLTHLWHPSGPPEALGIFAALFFGVWLRETNYAYWAACVTLVLALLAAPSDAGTASVLALRVVAIFVGALCGVAATWFVLPIRTTDVIRRRLADALVALDALLRDDASEPEPRSARVRAFVARMRALERVATPVRVHRRVLRFADHPEHPGRWIEIASDCRREALASELTALSPTHRATIVRAIGRTRKAIGAHGKPATGDERIGVAAALRDVHAALHDASLPRMSERA